MDAVRKSRAFEGFETYTRQLHARIVRALGEVDGQHFERRDWTRAEGGAGQMATIRGPAIEKGAVLVSSISGPSNPLTQKPFHAAGLSVIIHPMNPHTPTVHFNIRRFEEPDDAWWGGGTDLTPMGAPHAEDVDRFHAVLRKILGPQYHEGKAEADRYFFLPHRGRPRGAGGVFYDHIREPTDALARSLGDCFMEAYVPILKQRKDEPYTDAEPQQQLKDRGIYVEFNLLYDRGTRFGLESGGNVDAILSSLPPLVRW